MSRFLSPSLSFALVALGIFLAASAGAQSEAEAPEADPVVKVSLSRNDPDMNTATSDESLIEFFLFLDGMQISGIELGAEIEGGELLAYAIDTEKAWLPVPYVDPYPGTISQVATGTECFEPPVLFGRLLVVPDEPGGEVRVDVHASDLNELAMTMKCNRTGRNGLKVVPAAVNATPAKPHGVRGKEPGEGSSDHSHDDHSHDDHSHDAAGPAPDPGSSH